MVGPGQGPTRDGATLDEPALPVMDPVPLAPLDKIGDDALPLPTLNRLQSAAVHGSWWTAVAAVAGLPLSLFANLVVARALGPGSYGTVATYMTAYSLIGAALDLGFGNASIQWGARFYAAGDRASLVEMFRRYLAFRVVIGTPLMALSTLLLLHDESVKIQVIASATAAATLLLGGTQVALSTISRNAVLAKLSLGVNVFMQLSIVAVATLTHAAGPTWTVRLVCTLVGPGVAIALLPLDLRRTALRPSFSRGWPQGFLKYSFKVLFSGLVASLVFSRSEVLILNAEHLAVATGVFALAAGLAGQLTAPLDAMLAPLIPAAASLLEVDLQRARTAVLRGLRLSSVAMMLLMNPGVPVIALILPLVYGPAFSESGTLFVALAVVSCLQTVLHPVTAFVMALRRPLLRLVISAGALVFDLGITALLASHLGATGAVIGNTIGQAVTLFGSVLILDRLIGLPFWDALRAVSSFWLSSIVVVACTVGGFWLEQSAGIPALGCALVAMLIATAVPAIVVRTLGIGLKPADLAAVQKGLPSKAKIVVRALGLISGCSRPAADVAGT